jgi:hypothetical protein
VFTLETEMKELQAKVAHLNMTLATKDKEIQDLS